MTDISRTLQEWGEHYSKFKNQAGISQRLKFVLREAGVKNLSADKQEAIEMICHGLACVVTGDADDARVWEHLAYYPKMVEQNLTGNEL